MGTIISRPTAGGAVLALVTASAAMGHITYRHYASTTSYGFNVKHMPDFDQRRLQTESVPGLPNSGNMYCAPASVMNICAYIAAHGFPEVPPGYQIWQNRHTYDIATGSLFILGLLSGTDSMQGTGGGGWLAGAEAWVPLDLFTVQAFYRTPTWWPRRWDMAQSTYNGSLVALCYGFYDTIGTMNGIPVIARNGGHCVTLTGMLSGSTPNPFITVRDPADDMANTTQSTFVNRTFYTESRLAFEDGILRAMDNLANTPGDPLRRVLDGYLQIRPKAGVTWDETAHIFITAVAATPWGAGAGSTPASPPGSMGVWTLDPEMNRIYGLVDQGFGEQVLYSIGMDGTDPMELDVWSWMPRDIAISSRNIAYIAQDWSVQAVDLSAYPPDPVAWLTVSGPVAALAVDDASGWVHLFLPEAGAIVTYDRLLQHELAYRPLPGAVGTVETAVMALDPTQPVLWAVFNSEPVAWRIPLLDGGAVQDHELSGAVTVTSIDVDDQGHLFVADAGVLREYRPIAPGVLEPVAGPLAGMQAGARVVITKNRTNFDPALHSDGWHNVETVEEDWGNLQLDCDEDLDGNGAVDFGDLLILLAAFGPCPEDADCIADLDHDEHVGFSDLLLILSRFGPCP
ncbi:MAG: hypothetical protein KF817_00935 [Phycisphaeraceae bacterium]|nr:hypothetical protein [Phycisphaeraceae bacterium]